MGFHGSAEGLGGATTGPEAEADNDEGHSPEGLAGGPAQGGGVGD